MTMREFGAALDVTGQMVALWETSSLPDNHRLIAWLKDDREWVWQMALEIYLAKNRDLLAAVQKHLPVAA